MHARRTLAGDVFATLKQQLSSGSSGESSRAYSGAAVMALVANAVSGVQLPLDGSGDASIGADGLDLSVGEKQAFLAQLHGAIQDQFTDDATYSSADAVRVCGDALRSSLQ